MITCVCLTRWPDRSEMLFDALRAYAIQTYPNRRLIILNDGEPLHPLRSDIRVINWPYKVSVGFKRQRGLIEAGSTWMAPWDDDDFALPDHLGSLLNTAINHQSQYVRSASHAIADSGLNVAAVLRRVAFGSSIVWAPSAQQAGGYPDGNYGEDGALYFRLRLARVKKSLCQDLTYIRRRHVSNISNRYDASYDSESGMVVDSLHDQSVWPDLTIQTIQRELDLCRQVQTPVLIKPVLRYNLP